MKFNLLDSIMYYLSLTILIILTPIQLYSNYQVYQEFKTGEVSSNLLASNTTLILISAYLLLVVISLLFLQIRRFNLKTDFTMKVKRYAVFGLYTLGVATLSILMFVISSAFGRGEVTSLALGFIIASFLLVIYFVGSIFLIVFLSAGNQLEREIHRGLILQLASLIVFIFTIFASNFISTTGGSFIVLFSISFVLLVGSLIYSNYTVKRYKFTGIKTSDEDIELYKSADQ